MNQSTFNLQDFSIADSDRLLREGFAPSDLVSLYHNTTPIVASADKGIES